MALLYYMIPSLLKLVRPLARLTLKLTHIPIVLRPLVAKIRLFYTAIQEPEIAEIIKRRLQKDWIFVDVGAFVGFYTRLAAHQIKNGFVIAIEPEPENFEPLRYNCGKLKNVILLNVALLDKTTNVRFYIRSPMTSSVMATSGKWIEVQATTLDSLIEKLKLPRVDGIKIDVEGAELKVLKGMKNCLKITKFVVVEVHSREALYVVKEFLTRHGFQVSKKIKHIIGVKAQAWV